MKEIINKYIDTFKVTKVKIMNKIKFENNPMIIHLPEGAGYVRDDYAKETFNKVRIDFEIYKEQEVFTILVDDFLYIGADGKLIDNEEKKARFGKDRRNKKGEILQEYSSIFARAMMVAAKIIEGEIKISDEINKIEDWFKVYSYTILLLNCCEYLSIYLARKSHLCFSSEFSEVCVKINFNLLLRYIKWKYAISRGFDIRARKT